MELKVGTIAQRKAARRASADVYAQAQDISQVPTEIKHEVKIDPVATPLPVVEQTSRSSSVIEPSSAGSSSTLIEKPRVKALGSTVALLNPETLAQLAQSMGYELSKPKRTWIKHSFTTTPETLKSFKEHCGILDVTMQEALEEAFQDWFKKHRPQFEAVVKAKGNA